MSIPVGVASNRFPGGSPPGTAPAPYLFARFLGVSVPNFVAGSKGPAFVFVGVGLSDIRKSRIYAG